MSEKRIRRRSYSQYLRGEKSTDTKEPENPKGRGTPQVKEISLKPPEKSKRADIKIIRRPSSKKSKNRFTRKSHGKVDKAKDINYIERVLSQKNEPKAVAPTEKVVATESKPKAVDPKVSAVSRSKTEKPKTKTPQPKPKPRRDTHRHTKRGRGNHQRPRVPKGRKVSIRNKRIKPIDVEKIERKIQSIRNKSSKDIRSELSKDGIQVSGKSNRLLKDIYFYSKVCNINIRHEK